MALRKRLGALFTAALLPVGAATLLSTGALVATTPTVLAAACWDLGCNGSDPQGTGCSASAYTVYTVALKDSAGTTLGTVELRYSNGCGANWARTTGYAQYDPHAAWADVYNSLGQHEPGDYTDSSPPTLLWSYMLGGAGEADKACGELVDAGSGTGQWCTNWA